MNPTNPNPNMTEAANVQAVQGLRLRESLLVWVDILGMDYPSAAKVMTDAADALSTLSRRIEEAADDIGRMRTALAPFAAFAEKAEAFVEARAKDGGSPILPSTDFRLSDFRAARAAIRSRTTTPSGPGAGEASTLPDGYEMFEGNPMKVLNGNRSGWWRFHNHYDRDGYCDNPARGY